jgi:DNA-binding NarL/FixJ family response regulator
MTYPLKTTIAILEPHAILRKCMDEILSHLEYDVLFQSGSGVAFLEELAVRDELPEIIISEPRLRDLPDISIFRHLKFHYPNTLLVAYSADNSEWTIETSISEGADTFIEKGCSLHELQLTLATVTAAHGKFR